MRAIDEWCFDFRVNTTVPEEMASIGDIMDVAIDWAEAHGLSIGGGFRPISESEGNWQCRFGLYQRDGQPVPEISAEGLEARLREWCNRYGFQFVEGHREFTSEETGGAQPCT